MSKQILSRRAFLRTTVAGGASLAAVGLHAAPKGLYTPGTYSARASGIGDVIVTMTFDSDKITDVVLDVSHETPSIGQAAAEALKKSLLAGQTAEIDAVSGATITSKAVRQAAAKCIARRRLARQGAGNRGKGHRQDRRHRHSRRRLRHGRHVRRGSRR